MGDQINKLSILCNRMVTAINQTTININIVEAKNNINEQINIKFIIPTVEF